MAGSGILSQQLEHIKEKKEIWPSPMTKALHQQKSKKQRDNTKTQQKLR